MASKETTVHVKVDDFYDVQAALAAAEARGRQWAIDALRAEARKRAGEVRLGGHAWCDAAADFLADFITKEGRNAAD